MNGEDSNEKQISLARESVNRASSVARAAHLTFVLFGVYLAVLVGSTTDVQLLVGTTSRIPLLDVELPVVGLFVILPIIFFVLHLNLLILMFFLSRKIHHLQTLIGKSENGSEDDLLHLEPFPFTHMLSGTFFREVFIRGLLKIYVFLTVIFFPIALILFTQIWFLPYHSEFANWLYRVLLTLDVIMMTGIWLSARYPTETWSRRLSVVDDSEATGRPWVSRLIWGRIVTVALLVLAIGVPSFWMFQIPPSWDHQREEAARELYSQGKIFQALKKQWRFWIPRRLFLREKTLVAQEPSPEILAAYIQSNRDINEAWVKHARGLDLRDRDLRFAGMSRCRLYNVDLRGAKLQGVYLGFADLQGASLKHADLRGAILTLAQAQGVGLESANLEGAFLPYAKLQGANLDYAKLQGASLNGTELQNASLTRTELQGANLIGANLQGSLMSANLQGANLLRAQLQNANLGGTNLRGADLSASWLKGTNLKQAKLDWTLFYNLDCNRPGTVQFKIPEHHLLGASEETLREIRQDEKETPISKTKFPTSPSRLLARKSKVCNEWDVILVSFEEAVTEWTKMACEDEWVAKAMAFRVLMHARPSAEFEWARLAKQLLAQECPALKNLPEKERNSLKKLVESHERKHATEEPNN